MTHHLDTTTWAACMAGWIAYMRASACTNETVKLRSYHLERVGRELGGRPLEVDTSQLLEWLSDQDWKPNTRRSYRASLRAFFAWAVAAGVLERSPAAALPAVRVPRAMSKPTPEAGYQDSLRLADDRLTLAIRLAGACGLRRGEVARARREDVASDLVGYSLHVVGKGGKERWVPLPDDLASDIRARPAGWLFPSPRGGHLTPAHLGKLVAAELPGGFATHSLRHRCGTVAYRGTKDIRAVQELLGHAKLDTTMLYTQVAGESVRAAVEAAA